jgi:hypothetical protein
MELETNLLKLASQLLTFAAGMYEYSGCYFAMTEDETRMD